MGGIRDIITELCLMYAPMKKELHNPSSKTNNTESIDLKVGDSLGASKVDNAHGIISKTAEQKLEYAEPNPMKHIVDFISYFKETVVNGYTKLINNAKKGYSLLTNKAKSFFKPDKKKYIKKDPSKKLFIRQMVWYGILPRDPELRKAWSVYVT